MSKSSSKKRLKGECGDGNMVVIAGSWVPAGTGVTAPTGVIGAGFTVTQSASGVFNIAFTNPYKQRIAIVATAMTGGETSDFYAQTGDVTAADRDSGQIIRVRTMTGGTPTDMSGETTPRVEFVAVFSTRTI